jgi:hypothetical protein
MFHIDPEKEKWIDGTSTLGHGIHVLYVVPSCQHDMSSLVVTGMCQQTIEEGEGKMSFSFSGFFKTIL